MSFDRMQAIYNTGKWKDTREAVRRRDGHACVKCGRRSGVLDVDHIEPPTADNASTWFAMSNLRTLCRSCHRKRMTTTGDQPTEVACPFHNPPTRSCPHSRDW